MTKSQDDKSIRMTKSQDDKVLEIIIRRPITLLSLNMLELNMEPRKLELPVSKMAREKILVVEDEEEIRELVGYNLVKQGYQAILAGSAEDGLKKIRTEVPDLIVLDLMLPGMDGLEVCRNLKRDMATQSIPIVMLTAKGEETDVVAGLELGADDYITKPFSPRVLLAQDSGHIAEKDGDHRR